VNFREAGVVETEQKNSACANGSTSARKEKLMSEFSIDAVFDAKLPDLARPVRIKSFYEAQVFVQRWMIRDKDPLIRLLCRKLQRANSALAVNSAIRELKQELAARGLLPIGGVPHSPTCPIKSAAEI
jgi:hypothetical protein